MDLGSAIQITATTILPTRYGNFRFESFRFEQSNEPHLALSMGLHSGPTPLVRIHSECMTGDTFASVKCDCGDQLNDALDRIGNFGCGLIVYLRQEGRGIGIEKKIQAYALQENGLDTIDANLALGLPVDARTYDPAVAYLKHARVMRCVLLTNNPDKLFALGNRGIQTTHRPLKSSSHAACQDYLATKRTRLGHCC